MTNPYEPAPPDPTQRPARIALYLGVILSLAGLVFLWGGYQGTAKNPYVEAQIPYVISGGLAGLAFMLLGGIGLAASVVLRVTGEIREELHMTRDAFNKANRVASGVSAAITPEALTAAHSLKADAATATTNGSVLISTAGSSFHRADCRLVERAEQVSKVPRADASAQGFAPCRVCNP